MTAGEVAAGGVAGALSGSRLPGERVVGCLRQAGREATFADLAAQEVALVQDVELRSGLEAVASVASALERARVRMACEAAARGLHTDEGMTLADWLALRCPDLARPVLHDLVRVAQAGQEGVHDPLLAGVLSRGMPLARAATLHRALARVRGALSPQDYGSAVELLADAGCNPVFDTHDIKKVVDQLLRVCLPEKDHEDAARARRELRDVHESSLADGSVRRIIWTFGDDADYEAVRAILRSPLAAPATQEEVQATGEQDRRTPGQRRYDALMTVVRRGVAGTKGQPTTAKATLLVTMDLETLQRSLAESGGVLPGCGATVEGGTVSAEAIRRLACEADLIPLVLDGPSEIVDQGRRKRLVTPGQRVRLAVRDGGCTIPGCTVPATWCDAHHIVPWANGGRSDLDNYALLCERHHTWVHERNLTAVVTAHGVLWFLR